MNPLNIQQYTTDLGALKTLTNYWYPENKSGAYQARPRLGNSIDEQNKSLRNSTFTHLREIPDPKYYVTVAAGNTRIDYSRELTIEELERLREFLGILS